MLIGEVKEGRARLNPAMRDPEVLRAALARFGCCPPTEAARFAGTLIRRGQVDMPGGHRVRIVAFGIGVDPAGGPAHTAVDLGHVVRFLGEHFRQHWPVLRHAQFKDDVLALLILLEKTDLEGREGVT